MKNALTRTARLLAVCGCGDELLLGDKSCYGDGVQTPMDELQRMDAKTGARNAPTPTLCRPGSRDAAEAVECLGIEDVLLEDANGGLQPRVQGMVAPEPGVVVFSVAQSDACTERSIARLVRVESSR